MTSLTEDVQVEIALEDLTVANLLTMAGELGLTFPSKTRKSEIISGIIAKREELSAQKQAEEEAENAPIGNDLSMFKDAPENVVNPLPMSGMSRKGSDLSLEEIRARVETARRENAEAEEMRKAAEASKAKYVAWEPTQDELNKRYHKIGYAVGLVIQATNRLEKELKVSEQVIEAMGEEFDRDAVELAREAAIEGFAKAWDTYKFPSKAMRGMRGDALTAGIWNEIRNAQPGLPIFAHLEDESLIPSVEEEGEGEEDEE